jgi:hypothetical protein
MAHSPIIPPTPALASEQSTSTRATHGHAGVTWCARQEEERGGTDNKFSSLYNSDSQIHSAAVYRHESRERGRRDERGKSGVDRWPTLGCREGFFRP